MNLDTLAQLAQVAGSLSVIAAIVFGLQQLRQVRQQRHDMAALEITRVIQGIDFLRALHLVQSLPSGTEPDALRRRGPQVEEAALMVAAQFETLGLLVFRGSLPLELFELQAGGVVSDVWRRLRLWVIDLRARTEQPLYLEWFQWIAEIMLERGRPAQRPAWDIHRQWKAPS